MMGAMSVCDTVGTDTSASETGTAMREGLNRFEKRSVHRLIVVVAVVIIAIVIIYFTPTGDFLKNIESVKNALDKTGIWAPVLFFIASSVLIGVGFSRLFLCFLSGMLFGFVSGFPLILTATIAGSYAAFAAARWAGMHTAAQKMSRYSWLRSIVARHTIMSVAFVRQIPVSGVVLNMYLGATSVRHSTFLIGSIVGYVPSTAIAALLGSGVGKSYDKNMSILQLVLAGVFALLTAAGVYFTRRHMSIVKNENENISN